MIPSTNILALRLQVPTIQQYKKNQIYHIAWSCSVVDHYDRDTGKGYCCQEPDWQGRYKDYHRYCPEFCCLGIHIGLDYWYQGQDLLGRNILQGCWD